MDDISHHSLSNASWENPFSFSGSAAPSETGNGEEFFGDELKAFFDKEEKMYQSTSSGKSDQSNSHTEKSSAMMASGITIRSFMVESGDSELINQKLTMSQYLAYKSEPMGALGDSASFRERPYFSFQEKSLQQSSTSEKSEPAEFNPDFSQEPSWLKKKSLSSLSSSENLEIPSKSPDTSENWLIGTNKSVSSSSLNFEKSEGSSNYLRDPSIRKSDVDISNVMEPSLNTRRSEVNSIQQLTEKFELRRSDGSNMIEPSIRQSGDNFSTRKFDTSNHSAKESSIQLAEKSNYVKEPSSEEKLIEFSKIEDRQPPVQDIGETSELPSLYWKPHESQMDLGQSELVVDKATSRCHSYVAGHVESLSLGSDTSRRPSEVAASSQSSSSRASTVRENTDFPRCDSLISEPQLSSTREITDDYTDLSLSEKRVHFLPDSQRPEVSHISMEKQTLRLDTLLEGPSKPNLCSTAMTPMAKASEHMMRILANLSRRDTEGDPAESQHAAATLAKVLELETTNNEDWQRLERDLTTQHDPAGAGLSPESWIAVFSNTSSLSTPVLMNKIREHVLRLQGRGMSSDPSESSGIGGSGFETTESRVNSVFDPPPMAKVTPQNPAEHQPTSNNTDPAKYLRNRHTLSVMPPAKPDAQTPVDSGDKNFARLTSTVIKKLPTPDNSKPSIAGKSRANLLEQQQSLQVPLVKCNKSQVYFGGCKVRQMQTQNVIVRNSSFKQGLELELRIKDSDAFYLLEADRSLVSRRHIHLEPRQESCVDLVFQPHNLGPSTTKLNLYPRSDSAKKVKYTVDLYGYGGSSQINAGPDNILLPKSKGAHWNCQLVLENRGNVAGFACIHPVQEDGTPMDPYQCIVMPQLCSVNAGDFQDVQVLIHPPKDVKFGSFKLQVVWGDEPLRNRWIKCIANGSPIKPPVECAGIDFTKLLQPIFNDNQVVAISEEDLTLFYNNTKTEEMSVIFPDNVQDSHFVTLAAEPATVLEASMDTMMSQRRMTSTVSGKPPSEMCVSAGITELVFPSTKVGFMSAQKIPLQNWSSTNQEVRVKDISGPFSMKHTRSAVPGGYYTRLPIQFQPTKSGSYSGCVVLDVGQKGQSLTIALKGDAF